MDLLLWRSSRVVS